MDVTQLTDEERAMAKAMAHELATTFLEVGLLPAPTERHHGHHVRAAISHNPKWYRDLCAAFASNRRDAIRWRKHKTKIKRRETLAALDRLASGRVDGVYTQRLIPYVRSEITAAADQFAAEAAAYEARTPRARARSYVRQVRA
jgi:hypothetical protein